MNFLVTISATLQTLDPILKAGALLAAFAGGAWVWYERIASRTRVVVRKLGLAQGDPTVRRISFEAENIGKTLTPLESYLTLTAYSPERKRQQYRFAFGEHGVDQVREFMGSSVECFGPVHA